MRAEGSLGTSWLYRSSVTLYATFIFTPAAKHEKKSKKTTKSDEVVLAAGKTVGEVNEQKVDLLLDMLKSADVTDTSREESKTVKELESEWGGGGREEGGREGGGGEGGRSR